MNQKRIIPVLLVDDGCLVKTKSFQDKVYLGDPINTINIFNEKEVDEVIVLDISATKSKSGANFDLVESLCSECFMPLAYGGGISSMEDIEALFKIGIEKVVINHAKHEVGLIESAARRYGSQSVVGAIDIIEVNKDKLVYLHDSKKAVQSCPISVAKELVVRGVGEIFVNFVDRDGLRIGYDVDYIDEMAKALTVPLIACGGAAEFKDLVRLANQTEVSAAAAGSVFALYGKYDAPLVMYPTYEYLKKHLN